MPYPRDDVPQTPAEAKACGWSWLRMQCQTCKHLASVRFDDLKQRPGNLPLAEIAQRFYCSRCKGRQIDFEFGAYVVNYNQPFAHYRAITFEDGRVVAPKR